jgi:hypothetical protein
MFVSANRFETCGVSLTKRKGFQRIFDGNKVLYAFQVALEMHDGFCFRKLIFRQCVW